MTSSWKDVALKLGRLAVREAPRILRQVRASRRQASPPPAPASPAPPTARRGPASPPHPARRRPAPPAGAGRQLAYAPQLDGQADPGEIVWAWVPYEEDPRQGKDRPLLVVGRDGNALLGLMLSSQGERDGQRNWFALGPGDWDRDAKPSWVRLDRVLEVDEDGIRREGAVLDRERFEAVARKLRNGYGWR